MKVYTKLADLPLPEKSTAYHDQIKSFLGEAPNHAGKYTNQPVQICWDKAGTFKQSSYLCHYYYVNYVRQDTTYTYNIFTTQVSKNHKAYIKWLLSDQSPYAELLKRDDIFIWYDEEKKIPLVIGCLDVQQLPAKLWANFLIASRLSAGWALSHPWMWLQENGFTADEAIVISTFFAFGSETITINSTRDGRHGDNFRKNHILRVTGPNQSDQPYNTMHGNLKKGFFFPKFRDRAYTEEARTPLRLTELNPCNLIWDMPFNDIKKDRYGDTDYDNTGHLFLSPLSNKSLKTICSAFNADKTLEVAFVDKIKKHLNEGKAITKDA